MEVEASKILIQISTLTLRELIREINKPELFVFSSNQLKTEVYARLKNRLYRHCEILCRRNRYDENVVKEICQITFIKAFNKIGKFKFDPNVCDEKLANSISAWLNIIASHSFLDFLAAQSKVSTLDESFEELESDFQSDSFEFTQDENNLLKLQDAWDHLNDKERLIIYYCIQHNCLSNNNHLP
jgi:DNA-directed RNA polymerase specialized sigma24 family protein